jgi:hypothetical protein
MCMKDGPLYDRDLLNRMIYVTCQPTRGITNLGRRIQGDKCGECRARFCHADTARAPLVPINAMRLCIEDSGAASLAEMPILWKMFNALVEDENIPTDAETTVTRVDQGAVVECNFCGKVIWNRHLHCQKCQDFDLCMSCFINGRSCQHTNSYIWAEIYPRTQCLDIVETLSTQHPDWLAALDRNPPR